MLSFEHYVSLRRLYLIFLMYSCRILSFHYKCSLFDLRMPEILVYVGIDFFFSGSQFAWLIIGLCGLYIAFGNSERLFIR